MVGILGFGFLCHVDFLPDQRCDLTTPAPAHAFAAVPLLQSHHLGQALRRTENKAFVASGTAATGQRHRQQTPSRQCRSYNSFPNWLPQTRRSGGA
jgi:hypothetical protein